MIIMDLLSHIRQNNFLLLLMEEDSYSERSAEIAKLLEKNYKVTYVCLSRPHVDVIEGLKKQKLSNGNFFFVDLLSSHYKEPKRVKNCVFLNDPIELEKIEQAVKCILLENKPDVLLFDNISSLLMFKDTFHIIKFTHNLMSAQNGQKAKTIYYAFKFDSIPDNNELLKDLSMFADITLDLSKSAQTDVYQTDL